MVEEGDGAMDVWDVLLRRAIYPSVEAYRLEMLPSNSESLGWDHLSINF